MTSEPTTNIATPLHVAFVLDKSGSMTPLADAVRSGFDEFVSELRSDGADTRFSLTLFDTSFNHVHLAAPLDEVPALTEADYTPDGMTALFDAVAHCVIETDERLTAEGRADEKVMVVVLTDGLENSSTDYTLQQLSALISRYDERPNWTFVYLGAAHDNLEGAQDAAQAMSFKRSNAMRWTADEASARKSMGSLGLAVRHRRTESALKSDRVFEDAGQNEADYQDSGPPQNAKPTSSRPGHGHPTLRRRNLREVLDNDRSDKR